MVFMGPIVAWHGHPAHVFVSQTCWRSWTAIPNTNCGWFSEHRQDADATKKVGSPGEAILTSPDPGQIVNATSKDEDLPPRHDGFFALPHACAARWRRTHEVDHRGRQRRR